MQVAFDSRAAKDTMGIGRYVRCLLEALTALGHGELVQTHQPRPGRIDVYHAPCLSGALLRTPVPMVVTVHDLIPLKRPAELVRHGVRLKLRYLATQRAARVIVPTRTVADDLMRVLEIPSERIVVIGEAADPTFSPRSEQAVAAVRKRFSLPDRYLLWVGGLRTPDPHKRIAALAKAKRTMPLVLVGDAGPWAHTLPDVTVTNRVCDEDLAAIYTGAHALVLPSDEEGFGLTPVEALACGTPVVTCDVPAIREVLGDRADLIPVGDLEALVAAAQAARRPAPPPIEWTWADAAAATWEVYQQALAAPTTLNRRRRPAGASGPPTHSQA